MTRYEITMFVEWDERAYTAHRDQEALNDSLRQRVIMNLSEDPHVIATFGETYVQKV